MFVFVSPSGVIGLRVDGSLGALVEVNSETDFVARNAKFQGFVEKALEAALEKARGDGAVPVTRELDVKELLRVERPGKAGLPPPSISSSDFCVVYLSWFCYVLRAKTPSSLGFLIPRDTAVRRRLFFVSRNFPAQLVGTSTLAGNLNKPVKFFFFSGGTSTPTVDLCSRAVDSAR